MSNYDLDKALTKVVGVSTIPNAILNRANFDDIVSYNVVVTNSNKFNSRLESVLANGHRFNYTYNRENLYNVIKSELGLDEEVVVSGEVTSASVAQFFTDVGIAIGADDIVIENINNKAVRIRTTGQSLRFRGDVLMKLSASEEVEQPEPEPEPPVEPVQRETLNSMEGEPILDQQGGQIKTTEGVDNVEKDETDE